MRNPLTPRSVSSLGEASATSGNSDVLQFLSVLLLTLVALACLHGLLYHLHAILVPFVLSAFIVLALQPTVDIIYELLSGKIPPYRWCICGARRRRRRKRTDAESDSEGVSPKGKQCQQECRRECEQTCGCCGPQADGEGFCLLRDCEKQALLPTPRTEEEAPNCCEIFMDGMCRAVAVTAGLALLAAIVTIVIMLLGHGTMHMKENWRAYSDGLHKLEERQDKFVDRMSEELKLNGKLEKRMKGAYNTFLEKIEQVMWQSVDSIISDVSEGAFLLVWIMLYVLFWLFQPLPFAETAGNLVRSYMYKKTLVSALYGVCVTVLFCVLGIDLAVLFGVISFFLNYVPEVGAIISMAIPIPVILLDGRIENPFLVLLVATMGQMLLKFIFSNVLEVKLVERDRVMSIHPVWVVFGLSYFGFVWGPIGMLISVPMLALVKTAATSMKSEGYSTLSQTIAEGLLACLEGRRPGKKKEKEREPDADGQRHGFARVHYPPDSSSGVQ